MSAPATKGFVACAGQNHDAHALVVLELEHHTAQSVERLGV